MKLSVWDVLSILVLIVAVCVVCSIAVIFFNPHSTLNPFPPPTEPVLGPIPTATLFGKTLPPTWTPQAAVATITPRPTWTVVPTATLITLPTFTPYPTFTPVPPLPTITSTPGEFGCKISIQSPLNGGIKKPGEGFDGKWTLTNTGSKFWDSSQTQARYVSGYSFQTKNDYVNVQKDVASGGQTLMVSDMAAPSEPGTYTAVWQLVNDDLTICRWTFVLVVQK
jgi:hypothetical protein